MFEEDDSDRQVRYVNAYEGDPVPTSEFRPPSPGMAARSAPIPTSPQRGEVKRACVSLIGKCSNVNVD